mmetsp:Transcript_15109/g.35391  ORF Transcript_15109/g.35391 Transcript_15109/m.35391 type:complete len:161 (-) Transcript_15109:158-640(-)
MGQDLSKRADASEQSAHPLYVPVGPVSLLSTSVGPLGIWGADDHTDNNPNERHMVGFTPAEEQPNPGGRPSASQEVLLGVPPAISLRGAAAADYPVPVRGPMVYPGAVATEYPVPVQGSVVYPGGNVDPGNAAASGQGHQWPRVDIGKIFVSSSAPRAEI